jgi:hypothetical protein
MRIKALDNDFEPNKNNEDKKEIKVDGGIITLVVGLVLSLISCIIISKDKKDSELEMYELLEEIDEIEDIRKRAELYNEAGVNKPYIQKRELDIMYGNIIKEAEKKYYEAKEKNNIKDMADAAKIINDSVGRLYG